MISTSSDSIWSNFVELSGVLTREDSIQGQITRIESFISEHFNSSFFLHLYHTPQELNVNLVEPDSLYESFVRNMNDLSGSTQVKSVETGKHILGIPLFDEGSIFGLHIFSRETQFSEEEVLRLRAFGQFAVLSYKSCLLRQLHTFQEKQLKLVQNVTTQLVNITNLDQLASKVTDLILQTFNYYYVAVFTLEPSLDYLLFRASTRSDGSSQPLFEYNQGAKIKIGSHIVGHVARTGELLIANDVAKEPRYGHLDTLYKTKAEVALPLIINDQVVGVLDIQSEKINAFSESDIHLLKALANNIAIAIHRVRLFDIVQNRNEQLDAIEEISRAITFILDLDKLLEKVVNLIHDRFGYQYVHVFLVQPAENKIVFKTGSGKRAQAFKKAQVSYDLAAEKGIIVTAAKTRLIKRVNDVSKDENFIPNPISQEFLGSELAIPLIFGRQVLGVLDIQSDQVNEFQEQDQELLSTLAANIAIAVRNARLYHSETWRRQIAEVLRDVAISLSENKSSDNLLDMILTEIMKILPCDVAAFWLANEEDEISSSTNFSLRKYKTSDFLDPERLIEIADSQGSWIEQARNIESPLIRQGTDQSDPVAVVLNFSGDYSAISAPLQNGDQTIGFLTLHHHTSGRYGHESQNLTSSLAGYAAISIENTRLFEASQEQAWISTVLLQVAKATQSLSTIPELVSTVVRLTPLLVGVDGCAIFLCEPDSLTFMLHDYYGSVFQNELMDLPAILQKAPVFDELLETHAPVLITHPENNLGLPKDFISEPGSKTIIMLPLITHNELMGAFLVVQTTYQDNHSVNALNDDHLAIIGGITQQTATAVENIQLLESKQEEAYVSAALLQVAQAVVSSDNLGDILENIMNIIPILVGIDRSVIYLYDPVSGKFFPNNVHCNDQSIFNEDIRQLSYHESEFPLLDALISTNKPIAHPFVNPLMPEDWDLAIPDESIRDIRPILNSPFGLLLGLPLSIKGEFFGALVCQELKYYSNRERRLELLQGIAQQVSLAIQNDHLNKERSDRERIEREFQVARQIQRTFLPESLLQVEGYETDVRWHTARQVGGDFYDFFQLTEDQYGIVIADVSDKGLAASLFMTVARTLLRAVAPESKSTAETLARVNDLLLMDSQKGSFVTIVYAILEASSGRLRYTNAGHNCPYLLEQKNNKISALKSGGIAIGAMPDIKLPEYVLTLNPGDCLIMHTDGVTETFDPEGNMYDEVGYQETLRKGMGTAVGELLDLIDDDLSNFRRSMPLGDDTTLFAIKRLLNDK